MEFGPDNRCKEQLARSLIKGRSKESISRQ